MQKPSPLLELGQNQYRALILGSALAALMISCSKHPVDVDADDAEWGSYEINAQMLTNISHAMAAQHSVATTWNASLMVNGTVLSSVIGKPIADIIALFENRRFRKNDRVRLLFSAFAEDVISSTDQTFEVAVKKRKARS